MATEIRTKQLPNGLTVLCDKNNDAKTYVNNTHANNALAKIKAQGIKARIWNRGGIVRFIQIMD